MGLEVAVHHPGVQVVQSRRHVSGNAQQLRIGQRRRACAAAAAAVQPHVQRAALRQPALQQAGVASASACSCSLCC